MNNKDLWFLLLGAALLLFLALVAATATALRYRGKLAEMKRAAEAAETEANARVLQERDKTTAALSDAKEKILRYHSLISHGLRVPISIIMGYADILTGNMVSDAATRDEYLRKMCEKAAYMNELLTYSLLEMRYDTGTFSPMHRQFEVLSLLRGTAEAMSEMAAKKGVAIQVVSEQEEIVMHGNSIGLSKAFYNIVENALKYMGRPGSLNITASLLSENEVFIVFKDDGAGALADEVARILEMNYQGANARGGNGLGLWIVRTEVESHGGTVSVKSGEGKGMGVYITLPVNPVSKEGDAEAVV